LVAGGVGVYYDDDFGWQPAPPGTNHRT
jgi:hypothetical protein